MWGCSVRVVPSGLFRGVGVCDGVPMGCGHEGGRVCLGNLRVRYGGVGGRVDAMCGWGWVPRFALKYVELIGVCSLGMGFTCFTSGMGRARS